MKSPILIFFLALCFPFTTMAQAGAGSAITTGFNAYATVPNNAILNADSALTLEAWIKPTSFGPNSYNNVIISKDGWQLGEQGYTLRCGGNGVLSFNLGVQGSWQEVTSGNGALTLNVWQHVAGTFDGSTLTVYINGEQVGTNTFNGLIAASNYSLSIGRISYTAGGTRDFIGEVDEVRIWKAAVSQANLRDYMCQSVTASHPNYNRLSAYYSFDNATTTFTDNSPNTNNGSFVGATVNTSGAAIGDASAHNYTSPFSTNLAAPSGETFSVSNVSGSPTGIHLYRIDGSPSTPSGFSSVDTKYWGIFFAGGTNPTGDVTYNYASGTYLNSGNECDARFATRANFAQTTWTTASTQVDATNDQLFLTGQSQGEVLIGISNAPYATVASSGNSICQGDTVSLSIPFSVGTGYQWILNGGALPGDTSNTLETTQSGMYHLQITEGTCTYSTDTVAVAVNPLPSVSITAPTGLCILGGTDTLAGSPAGGVFSGPGVTGNVIDPIQAGLGQHLYTYSYTDSNNCSGIATDSVQVNPNPTVLFQGPYGYCENDAAFNMTMALPAGGVYSGPGVAANFFTPLAAGVGTHSVTYMFADSNGCTAEDSADFLIFPNPPTPVVTQVGNDLVSSVPFGNQWYNGTMQIIGATDSIFTPQTNGTYFTIIIDSNGCSSDTSNNLIFVGLENALNVQFALKPNPARENTKLILETDWLGEIQIQLIDLQGKVLFEEKATSHGNTTEAEMSLEGISAGLYWVRVVHDGKQVVQKLVVQ